LCVEEEFLRHWVVASLPVSGLPKNPLDYFCRNPAIFTAVEGCRGGIVEPAVGAGQGWSQRVLLALLSALVTPSAGNLRPSLAACFAGVRNLARRAGLLTGRVT